MNQNCVTLAFSIAYAGASHVGHSQGGVYFLNVTMPGRAFSLILTKAGREAIGLLEETANDGTGAEHTQDRSQKASGSDQRRQRKARQHVAANGDAPANASPSAPSVSIGTKQQAVVSMLSSSAGATIDTLMTHMGWLPHTTRAVLSGLRKRGHVIERIRDEEGRSCYRITGNGRASAGA